LRLEKLSNKFINKFLEIAAGSIPSTDFEILLTLFENEIKQTYFTQTSEANLLRIINRMYDKTFFLNECIKYPHYVEILISVASNSNYLSDIIVINPEYFYLVVDPSRLNVKLKRNDLSEELKTRTSLFSSLNAKVHAINTLKRKEILRIGLKDIFLKNDLSEITNELSILASSLTAELFSICYDFILKKYKIEKVKSSYCIMSLGKLGGNELNYSSDIDLIIFYDKETKLVKIKDGRWMMDDGKFKEEIQTKYYSEIFSEVIQLFLEKAASSEAGFLYRVDLRLRPDGKSSAVCRSIGEYLDYYETRGHDWERQMLIKADYLAGNKNLYNQFSEYLDSFIYPATIFSSPIEQMKKLKKISENEIEGAGNIKFVPGGIRDIEFIVQGLQLLNGGRNESLKTGNTLTAISKLQDAKLLSANEAELLSTAYVFYRKIEHYLQLMNNKQTHMIPQSGEIAEKLSYYLKFKSLSEFREKVEDYKKHVREIYDSILETPKSKKIAKADLSDIKFQNPKRALNDFKFLKAGKGLTISRKFDLQSVESFERIEHYLIEYLRNSKDPDLTLSNFVRVIKNADFPSIWYHEFVDEFFFTAFLNLCEYSQKCIELFAEDKELREVFLSREIFKENDTEVIFNYKMKKVLFILSSKIALSLMSANEASKLLSNIVSEKIKSIVRQFVKSKKWKDDYFIAIMGSTGINSMSFASDVDLIFAARNIQKYKKIEHDFQELLKLLSDSLSPFPADCRLRPEGDSSQLVWELDGYKKYFLNRAKIWEMQSFLKAKFICGNKRLFNSLVNSYLKRIEKLKPEEILKGIFEIRSKALSVFPSEVKVIDIKKNSGGLNDVEYIAHYLILSIQTLVKKNIGNSTPDILIELSKEKKDWRFLRSLADNYIFLKELDIFNQIAANSRTSKISEETERLNKLAFLLKIKNGLELKKKISSVLKYNRDAYNKLIT
jgi:glutamate-ammonia-ligase adenylyltransferase